MRKNFSVRSPQGGIGSIFLPIHPASRETFLMYQRGRGYDLVEVSFFKGGKSLIPLKDLRFDAVINFTPLKGGWD